MKKLLLSSIFALSFTSIAHSQELKPFTFSAESDTSYSFETEIFSSELDLSVAHSSGAYASAVPSFNLSDTEYTGVEFEVGFDIELNSMTITPYGTYTLDSDSEKVDSTVGLVTSVSF